MWELLEQWHEKQFVGRWARKKKAWMEILEAREIGET